MTQTQNFEYRDEIQFRGENVVDHGKKNLDKSDDPQEVKASTGFSKTHSYRYTGITGLLSKISALGQESGADGDPLEQSRTVTKANMSKVKARQDMVLQSMKQDADSSSVDSGLSSEPAENE